MRKSLLMLICTALLALVSQAAFAEGFTNLNIGVSGTDVRIAQVRLYTLGYLASAPDAPYQFDAPTKSAAKKFQLASGIVPANGIVDQNTFDLLKLSSAVTYDEYKDAMHVPGGSGAEVKSTEVRLKKLGYFKGKPNMQYDRATATCVTAFQRVNQLPESGLADAHTRRVLFSNSAIPAKGGTNDGALAILKKGDSGEQVSVVQHQLSDLGYYKEAVTSTYNAATVASVRVFQTANHLPINGVAGSATRTLLNSGAAKSFATYTSEEMRVTVKKGESGYAVLLLQTRLKELCYYGGAINGKFNATVQAAVQHFQDANNVNKKGSASYGIATEATRAVMNSSAALNRYEAVGLLPGDDLAAVKDMTTRLKALGYMTYVTSKYSDAVSAAVKIFQTASKLPTDGIADPETLSALYDDNAISYDEYKMGSGNAKIEKMISIATSAKLLGVPYKSPCNPPANFDCSGFTRYVFAKMGVKLSGEVTSQANSAASRYRKIADMADLKRGDLLYFDTQEGVKPIGHAAIYLGKSNGKPRFVHASSERKCVVVSAFSDWYTQRFVFGVRVWE
ncbi:MAG: peptidoglycan-binding protein [Clostridia bacterium]